MPKTEVNWTRADEDGQKRQVTAHSVGGKWIFKTRRGRFDLWEPMPAPELQDWLELLDGVKRRVGRRLATPKEEAQLRAHVRTLFPGEDVPG